MMTNHGNRITQGQFSFLPDLTDAQITAQIEYALKNDWAISVEYTGTPAPNGPRSVKVRLVFAASATNAPFLVPMLRISRSAIHPPETAGRIVITSPALSCVSTPLRSRTLSAFTNTFK